MKRREFLGVIGGVAAAWPAGALGQQRERARRIGVLMGSDPSDPQMQARIAAFTDGLQKFGWRIGSEALIDVQWYGGSLERATSSAKAFADGSVDVIVANGTIGIEAARKITNTIPIVFALVGNPVGSGFVDSLAHPGGNVTGFSAFEPEIAGKWVQVLKEIAPNTKQVVVLLYPGYEFFWRGAEAAGPELGIDVSQAMCRDAGAVESAVSALGSKRGTALVVLPAPFFAAHRDLIVRATVNYHLPAVYPFRYFATAGGLVSYGIDAVDIYRRTAGYVDRILKGENPADLPVQAPVKYELVVNLKAAKAIGLEIPPTLLARADEVIE
jgi:putative ABC transport system substrate-binding protein